MAEALALYARAAPAPIDGTIIGINYLHLFVGNQAVGVLGALLEKMPAVVFLIVGRFFANWLSHENTGGRPVQAV